MRMQLWFAAFVAIAFATSGHAQDLPGAQDHPMIPRPSGSALIGYDMRSLEGVEFQTSTFQRFDLGTLKRMYARPPLALEGKLSRYWYELPEVSSTAAFHTLAQTLEKLGFKVLYDSTKDKKARGWTNFLYPMSTSDLIKNNRSDLIFRGAKVDTIRTGTFQKGEVAVRVIAVYVSDQDKLFRARPGAYLALDVVEKK